MALIDVSDILLDPDFVDPMSLLHRTTYVDDFGKNSLTETRFNTYGSIQPVSGKDLSRVPESLKTSDIRTYFIKATVVTGGNSDYPDIIEFQNNRYQIKTTESWANWGGGWYTGFCVLERISA